MIKQQRYASIFLLILGSAIWGSTLWVRMAYPDLLVVFPIYFGSAPNLGTSMMMAPALVFLSTYLQKKAASLKWIGSCAIFTSFCQILSESYYLYSHQVAFQWIDILYGIVGLVLVVLVYYFL
ncbi:hypothetical protein [Isobaculum melis]|uniref:Uncharacterized protein n=1 Tax=Isobaculum melis TaxID=142588 RepID=A0A1H9QFL8_9LACT|nr:hypothetical protein [Isobaculum melis]SER58975.1 hypothetical protein SAMN04488559_10236 [Isobaculum melis]